MRIINAVENPELHTLLELRYLCFKTWEEISVEMGYTMRHLYRMRDEAFKKIVVPTKRCH